MHALFGRARSVAKLVGNLNNIKFNRVLSGESKFSGCSINQPSHTFSSEFSLNRNFGSRILSAPPSRSYSLASVLPSSRDLSLHLNQPASSAFNFPARSITTADSTTRDASVSPDVPQRVKFKRLDKTARHIMQIIDKEAVEEVKGNREIPDIRPGYIVQLKVEVPENKRRVSIIKGIVIARRNAGINTTFRIRRLVAGVGIESLFPLYSPNIKEIKVLDKKRVRRAKLYYLRDKMNALKKQ